MISPDETGLWHLPGVTAPSSSDPLSRAQRHGVLLVNLGTPDSPSVPDVRRYLHEFLSDPRVIDIPAPARWLLLHGVILRTRPRLSAAAYELIWTPEGSPLLVHGRALREGVAAALGEEFQVELAMRYGRPGLANALDRLLAGGVDEIRLLSLFPQNAEATTGSVRARLGELLRDRPGAPPLVELHRFYDAPGFIRAHAAVAKPALDAFGPDHVLFSYHGLPERQVRRADPSGRHCLVREDCCQQIGPDNRHCYRAQCMATTRALADALALPPEGHSTAFQSRLGRTAWLEPSTQARLPELARAGVRRLAVLCPAFVADCLETLEEIGLRGRRQWLELGGEDLRLVPSLNASPAWVDAVADLIRAPAERHDA